MLILQSIVVWLGLSFMSFCCGTRSDEAAPFHMLQAALVGADTPTAEPSSRAVAYVTSSYNASDETIHATPSTP